MKPEEIIKEFNTLANIPALRLHLLMEEGRRQIFEMVNRIATDNYNFTGFIKQQQQTKGEPRMNWLKRMYRDFRGRNIIAQMTETVVNMHKEVMWLEKEAEELKKRRTDYLEDGIHNLFQSATIHRLEHKAERLESELKQVKEERDVLKKLTEPEPKKKKFVVYSYAGGTEHVEAYFIERTGTNHIVLLDKEKSTIAEFHDISSWKIEEATK